MEHLLNAMDRLLEGEWVINVNRRDWINQIFDLLEWESDLFFESIKEELNQHREQAVAVLNKIVKHVNHVETEQDFQQRIDEELRLRAASVLGAFFNVHDAYRQNEDNIVRVSSP